MSEGRPLFGMNDDRRIGRLTGMAGFGFLVLVFRLFQLQIVHGPGMANLAEQNRTQIIPLLGPRGLVKDRKGEVLLDNAPRFSLFYSDSSVPPRAKLTVEADMVRWFPQEEVAFRRKIGEARRSGKMTKIASQVPREVAFALLERRPTLPGVSVVAEPQRYARYGALASHLLGYVDEISPAELARFRSQGYRRGQLIGKTGVERVYDATLRGQDGGLQFEMDANGRHVRTVRRIPSKAGADLVLTLDRRLQETVENGLRLSPTGRGAAVVVDPRNGAILALASAPDFNLSADRASSLGDPGLPFFNRAVQGAYPPGSLFKIATAAGALKNGWNIHTTFFCSGDFPFGGREFGCWSKHFQKDFMGAMAWSCDVYFYNMGLRLGPKAMGSMARAFGMGEKSGIDLPFESSGFVPEKEWKRRVHRTPWFDGDTLNLCIGQGALTVTPLQMAMFLGAVANGGSLHRPYVVEKSMGPDGQILFVQEPKIRQSIDLSPEIWSRLQKAMEGVVSEGSGRIVYRKDLVVGAKTGTAQNPHGEDHAWFAAYGGLPGQPASLAVVAFVENGGTGSAAAGPIVRQVIDAAFGPERK